MASHAPADSEFERINISSAVEQRARGWQMVKCGPAGMRACSLGLVGLGFRVGDKVRVSVSDMVGVRVSDGVRLSTLYFLSH